MTNTNEGKPIVWDYVNLWSKDLQTKIIEKDLTVDQAIDFVRNLAKEKKECFQLWYRQGNSLPIHYAIITKNDHVFINR